MILYRRGKGARRRVAHIATFSQITGEVSGALCGASDWNTSCNLGLGLRLCKRCLKKRSAR